jgi:hypothetical protein
VGVTKVFDWLLARTYLARNWFWIHPLHLPHHQPLHRIFCMKVLTFWAPEMLKGRWPEGYASHKIPWSQIRQIFWLYTPLDVRSAYSFISVPYWVYRNHTVQTFYPFCLALYPEQITSIRALQISGNLAVCPLGMWVTTSHFRLCLYFPWLLILLLIPC